MSGHASQEEGARKTVGAGRKADPHRGKMKKKGAISRAFSKIAMKTPPSPPAGETPAGGDDTCMQEGEAGKTFGTTPAVYQGKKVPKRTAAALPYGAADTPRGVDSPADATAAGETTRRPTGEDVPLSDSSWMSSAGESDSTDHPAADRV